MFIATSRKLQALGLLIAELKVKEAAAGEHTATIRSVVAQLIPMIGTVILGLYVLILSFRLVAYSQGNDGSNPARGNHQLAAAPFVHQGLLESADSLGRNF